METTLIAWPAIIKYAGEAELVLVESQSAWDADSHLHGARYEKSDVLIDSRGEIYTLLKRGQGPVQPVSTAKFAALDDVVELIRAHASQMGSCCVAKFSAASIEQALQAVSMLNGQEPR